MHTKSSTPSKQNLHSVHINKNKSNKELIEIGWSTLWNTQKEIVNECFSKGSGGLALPMGTGKTIISIIVALMSCQSQSDKILIVVAKPLIPEWIAEIHRVFGDEMKYEIFHSEYVKCRNSWVISTNIIITTPETLTKSFNLFNIEPLFTYTERPERFGPEVKYYRVPNDPYLKFTSGVGYLHSINWSTIIIDEAHTYFGIGSQRCMAMASLSARNRWLLSGTILAEPKPEKIFGYYILLNYQSVPRNLPEFRNYITSSSFEGVEKTFISRDENTNYKPPVINTKIISHSLLKEEALIYTNVKSLVKRLQQKLNAYKKNADTVNIKKY